MRWDTGAERVARFPEVYQDPRWEPCRQYVLARDMGLCQWCKAKGLTRAGNEIDHIVELTAENKGDPNIAFNPNNCRTMCHDCHNARHGRNGSGLSEFLKPVGS